jgi:hypothetical protein
MSSPQPKRLGQPKRAEPERPAETADKAPPKGAHPDSRSGPILREERWGGKLNRTRAHVAVVVVYHRGDHQVIWPHERSRVLLHRHPSTTYDVDLGLRHTVITADLPSEGYAGSFHASISVQWRVVDPSAVVRHRVLDIEEVLSPPVLRQARGIARKFSIGEVAAAEDAINDRLGGVMIDMTAPAGSQQVKPETRDQGCLGAEYGLWTRAVTHLTLDQAAIEHNTKMMKLKWAMEEEEAEQRLRITKNKNQQEITTARIAVYRGIIAAGDVERFALRLASHPDEISDITAIIREDQLTSRRDTIDFISHMVDSGVVERWEVSDQVREALEWLRDATARVVTDKSYKITQDEKPLQQHRRGRGKPIEEPPAAESSPEIIIVTAEEVPNEEGMVSETSPDAIAVKAQPTPPEKLPETIETTDRLPDN